MPITVFYSWQSELPGSTNRNLIQSALESAVKKLNREGHVVNADRDTQGVAGAPNIGETIFGKIDTADVFLADVTFVNYSEKSTTPAVGADSRPAVRLTPNANVLIELGYALKAIGDHQFILVMNTAYGEPVHLPFDLRQKRVATYSLKEDGDKAATRNHLAKVFEEAIGLMIPSIAAKKDSDVLAVGRRIDLLRELNEKRDRTISRWFRAVVEIKNREAFGTTLSGFSLFQGQTRVGDQVSRPEQPVQIAGCTTHVPIAAGTGVSGNERPRLDPRDGKVLTIYFRGDGRIELDESGPYRMEFLDGTGISHEALLDNVMMDRDCLEHPDYL